MNQELFHEVYENATNVFRVYKSKKKGQQITCKDSLAYWIAYMAYNKGETQGRLDGFDMGHKHALNGTEVKMDYD